MILNRNNKGFAFDDVYVFNPTLLLNFRYGLTYQDFPERRVSQGYRPLDARLFAAVDVAGSATRRRPPFLMWRVLPFSALSAWETGDGVTASNTNSFVGNFTRCAAITPSGLDPSFAVYRESARPATRRCFRPS